MPHTSATRRVAIVWLGLLAISPPSESLGPNVIHISGAKRVSRITGRATRIRNPFVSARYVAGPVERSRETISTNVSNGIVTTCKQNREVGHLCNLKPLKDVLPANADKVLYVYYDLEYTQNKRYSDTAKAHVPKLVCFQHFCARCEDVESNIDCARCGRRMHYFLEDTVGELLTSVRTQPLGQ